MLVVALVALLAFGWPNAVANMEARGIPLGFAFEQIAGFDINLSLIDYSALSTYGRAFWVGSSTRCWSRRSHRAGDAARLRRRRRPAVAELDPVARRARLVELMRNTPLLLQLLFWYNAVLKALPGPRQSLDLRGSCFSTTAASICRADLRRGAWSVRARRSWRARRDVGFRPLGARRQDATGAAGASGLVAARADPRSRRAAYFLAGRPIGFDYAALAGFNLGGGVQIFPEFAALVFGLVTYTAGFIAEIVRAGVLAVSHGQSEAAGALGLKRGLAMKLIVMPQALRLIIPPLTSQYLNIVKNRRSAVFIGYPDCADFRRHGAQSDARGGAGDGDHDGGLSRHFAGRCRWRFNLFNARMR